jgi:aquaporin Z
VVLGATSRLASPGFAGLAIGLALAVVHLIGIPLTGTSVNPARSLGPALVVGHAALSQVWLFIVAPLVGGIVAAAFYRFLFPAEHVDSAEVQRDREVARTSATP